VALFWAPSSPYDAPVLIPTSGETGAPTWFQGYDLFVRFSDYNFLNNGKL